ncbi:MAG: hypothetical protein M1834_004302 [Cirrosporium novae-zelandiae]|nr:MAG: hypothetical protein M1834_004302 [Cirrosporium novae-zelandiae]
MSSEGRSTSANEAKMIPTSHQATPGSTPPQTLGSRKRAATGAQNNVEPSPSRKPPNEIRRSSKGQQQSGTVQFRRPSVDPEFDRSIPYSNTPAGQENPHIWTGDDNSNANHSFPLKKDSKPASSGRFRGTTKHGITRSQMKLEKSGPEHQNFDFNKHPGVLPKPTTKQVKQDNKVSRVEFKSQNIDRDQGVISNQDVPDLVLQPETRPISQEQLINEVKSIYAGLVMVEKRCIDVDNAQAMASQANGPGLSNEQWHALIALHRTLLHEHHDFFLASQHPSASPALRKLAAKYVMPARMWRHGIHSFLEVLRHRLPESLDHMLSFIYLAYSMMALLYETVPTYEDTWIECLGDLGRYRMAIEDDDIRDREIWTGVSRFWYSKAADKNPNVGRLYHHLAILARPVALQQLYFYTRSLTCVQPFQSARESILTLLNPILEANEPAYYRLQPVETTFIRTHAIMFTQGSDNAYMENVLKLPQLFDDHINRVTAKFKEQGPWVAIANHAAFFEYGLSDAIFTRAYDKRLGHQVGSTEIKSQPDSARRSLETIKRASKLCFDIFSRILLRLGDKNIHNYLHITLVFLCSLASVEEAMKLIESDIPWNTLASFLNTLIVPGKAILARAQKPGFPLPQNEPGRPLPEDYAIRGQIWAQWYYPDDWFEKDGKPKVDEEERSFDLPSMAEPRLERILHLAFRIASFKKWLIYDENSKQFSASYKHTYVKEDADDSNSPSQPIATVEGGDDAIMTGTDEPQQRETEATSPLHVIKNEQSALLGQASSTTAHLESSHMEIEEDEPPRSSGDDDGSAPVFTPPTMPSLRLLSPSSNRDDVSMADSTAPQPASPGQQAAAMRDDQV